MAAPTPTGDFMSDTATPDAATANGNAPDPVEDDPTVDPVADAEKWKAMARKHEREAKSARAELDKIREATQSEQEKAINAAKAEGLKEGARSMASRIVDAEIRAAAAGRLDKDQLATLLEGLDRGRFVDDDGEVDTERVAKFVNGIAPKAGSQPRERIDLGQGSRDDAKPSAREQGKAEAARRFKTSQQ